MQFISYLENKFKTVITGKISQQIIDVCGPNLWLVKQAVRYYAQTKDEQNLFEHEEMNLRLKVILNEFDKPELEVIKKIAKKDTHFTNDEFLIIKFLEKTNFTSKLLFRYCTQVMAKENNLSLTEDKKLILNTIPVDTLFSKSEKKGLRYLLARPNSLVKRQELAEIIWGEEKEYTDWALDQFIKRLRDRVKNLGLSKDLIKTIKNKGFIFNK